MATSLIDLSGAGATAIQDGPAIRSFPFLEGATPDKYPRLTARDFVQLASSYVPTLGDRTSYTNYAQYSDASGNAYWNDVVNVTITDNQLANPIDGQLTAGKIAETAINANHWIGRNSITISAGDTICWSRLLKAGTRTLAQLVLFSAGSDGFYANFDLSAGTVAKACTAYGTGTAISAGIFAIGDGWYLCYVVGKIAAASTAAAPYTVAINSSLASQLPAYLGDPANYFYYHGAMFQIGVTSPGPFISTTGATRTISAPPTDYSQNSAESDADFFAYQASETAPSPTGVAGMARFRRTAARLPATQYEPQSRTFVRPTMHAIKSGSTYAVSFDGSDTWLFTSRTAVSFPGTGTYAPPVYKVTHTTHGRAVGDLMAIWSADTLRAFGPIIEVVDADNYYVNFGTTGIPATGYAAYKGAADVRLVTGAIECSARLVRRFYLPGVTPDVANVADIPNFQPVTDQVSWLGVMVAYIAAPSEDTYVVESTVDLKQWMGPILEKGVVEIQVKDAYVTATVGA